MYNSIIHKLSFVCKIPVVIYQKVGAVRPYKKLYTAIVRIVYIFFTGLIIAALFGGILFFVGYPLLPVFKKGLASLRQLSPYNIGYLSTVQILVKVSPSVDEFDFDVGQDVHSSSSGAGSSIENIRDDENISTSDLESKGTILEVGSISVRGNIVDGLSQESMLRGFWHYPLSSEPGKKGNTVIFGHRFDKLPPSPDTFFYLDQVVIGDKVRIVQNNRDFTYTVVKTVVVEKTDGRLLEDTGGYRLTLITCTPLWTSDKRLVVVAIQDHVATVI